MNSPWRIELFGGLQLTQEANQVISRFQTRKTAAILAYLAFHRGKITSREVLADLLWPETDPASARNSFRVALNSLRRQLEPPGIPAGAVLIADRASIHLNPAAFNTDVAEFEEALRLEKVATEDADRVSALLKAVNVYQGPLLTGWYEEWIDLEQARLAEVYAGVLRRLTATLMRNGEHDRALEYAHSAVHADPLREESHRNLMRLYMAVGQPGAAREQYRKLEAVLLEETDSVPSASTRELLKQINSAAAGENTAFGLGGALTVSADTDGSLPERDLASLIALPPRNRAKAERAVRFEYIVPATGSIPIQFTRFFGREQEVADLIAVLQPGARRLVTLTGSGGTGKTRLSVEIAGRLRDDAYAGRTWVVPLSDLNDANLIPSTILGVLRVTLQPEISIADQLDDALGGLPTLLVLDNLEQIAEPAAEQVRRLLSANANLTILATSRQRLGVHGEQDYPLAPLPTPSTIGENPEMMSRFPSIALFVDRARAVRPDFQITARNAAAIADLCRRLDGLPLAIELAAASIRLMSPSQMLQRLTDAVEGSLPADLLMSDRRDGALRHRSLRAVMDESYRLLPEDLRPFFARLSVFRGGWTLNAAQDLFGETYALDLLDLLQQRSLVVTRAQDDGIRFYLLETIRQYAEGILTEEQRADLHQQHGAYYMGIAEDAARHLSGPNADYWCDLLEAEHDNFRSVISWSMKTNPIFALRTSAALWRFWYARGYATEGLGHIESALRRLKASDGDGASLVLPDLLFRVQHGAGRLALSVGDTGRAASHFNEALAALDAVEPATGDSTAALDRVILMNDAAITAEARGDVETAQAAYCILVQLYRAREDPWAEACALSSLAATFRLSGRDDEARESYRRSAALRLEIGDRRGENEAIALSDSSSVVWESLPVERNGQRDTGDIAASFLQLGHIATERGDYAAARPLLLDALTVFERIDDNAGAAIAYERIAVAALLQGDIPTTRSAAEDALLLRRTGLGNGKNMPADSDASNFARKLLREIENL